MAYQALYRVWRPQFFKDMVGQEVVTQTLKNAIITKQTSHAYLFSGPRGTGKTSAAKIFAKALNCLDLKDGEPCNECINCQAINTGTLNDVIEIDAASNNGIEEIRDIRDKVKYAPTQGKFKVYIIDEVHMLSTGAFNALLKTLEEPPTQVVFILATTEPQKIPATIISRTQRFDFKRIKQTASLARMEYILTEKQITYDQQALQIIATAAEGGMRDALSILDQALSFADNKLTLDNALMVTGAVTQDLLSLYVQAVLESDTVKGLELLQQLLDEGKDANRFIEDLIGYVRDLLLANEAPKLVNAIRNNDFKTQAQTISLQQAYTIIEELNNVQQQLRYTTHADVYLEVLTVKLCNLSDQKVDDTHTKQELAFSAENLPKKTILKQLEKSRKDASSITTFNAKIPVQGTDTKIATKGEINKVVDDEPTKLITKVQKSNLVKMDGQAVFLTLQKATKGALTAFNDAYIDLLNMLTVVQSAKLSQAKFVAASDQSVVLVFKQPYIHHLAIQDIELQTSIKDSLEKLLGNEYQLIFITEDQWQQVRKSYVTQLKAKIQPDEMQAPILAQIELETKPQALTVTDETEIENEQDAINSNLNNKQEVASLNEAKNAKMTDIVNEAQTMFGVENIEIRKD
ncbi:DNA polymerase III subunit gamma/tau [Periweissella beninensis]|uniref:DNA polymerase III subunit gamma/tau n=1 Tax=Periweissella beninensis TaxID=504936 RepID=UPI0021A55C5F|nr:DNA polymerase III subunit gamma/tau [Periweissella beninensis]MCT4395851.1 DNA polymerase III subunit gamma/tau [Periweissella beninensis]